jgi:hypothetical protein
MNLTQIESDDHPRAGRVPNSVEYLLRKHRDLRPLVSEIGLR